MLAVVLFFNLFLIKYSISQIMPEIALSELADIVPPKRT